MSSIENVDETDYPSYREPIPLRQVVRVVEQELFDGWYDLYTAVRRERETVEAYKSMPPEFQERGVLDSLLGHWQDMEKYLRNMEAEGRRLLSGALESGALPQYVFNMDAPGRRMFPLPPTRDIRLYAPHGVNGQGVSLWEVSLWQDEFNVWFQETKRRTNGGEPLESGQIAIERQKRYSAKRQNTIDCLKELFPDTGGDPGDPVVISEIARKLKPIADAKRPEWASDELNTYEMRITSALPFLRAALGVGSKGRATEANIRQG